MSVSRLQLIHMYRDLIKASNSFKDYNFRMYALRRTREDFRDNAGKEDQLTALLERSQKELEILNRQSMIHNLYFTVPHIVEEQKRIQSIEKKN